MRKPLLILLFLGLAALTGCVDKGDLILDDDLPQATANDDAA